MVEKLKQENEKLRQENQSFTKQIEMAKRITEKRKEEKTRLKLEMEEKLRLELQVRLRLEQELAVLNEKLKKVEGEKMELEEKLAHLQTSNQNESTSFLKCQTLQIENQQLEQENELLKRQIFAFNTIHQIQSSFLQKDFENTKIALELFSTLLKPTSQD